MIPIPCIQIVIWFYSSFPPYFLYSGCVLLILSFQVLICLLTPHMNCYFLIQSISFFCTTLGDMEGNRFTSSKKLRRICLPSIYFPLNILRSCLPIWTVLGVFLSWKGQQRRKGKHTAMISGSHLATGQKL